MFGFEVHEGMNFMTDRLIDMNINLDTGGEIYAVGYSPLGP